MNRLLNIVFAAAAATSLFLACSGHAGPAAGQEKGSCYPNGTCNQGLSCFSNKCVRYGGAGGGDGGGGVAGGGTAIGAGGAVDAAGTTGDGGVTGAAGMNGAAGGAGTGPGPGAGGAIGAAGVAGTAGVRGTAGVGGTGGAAGTTSAAGTAGAAGTTGSAGISGAGGATSAGGATGAAGSMGAAGTGAAGSMGGAGSGAAGSAACGGSTGSTGTSEELSVVSCGMAPATTARAYSGLVTMKVWGLFINSPGSPLEDPFYLADLNDDSMSSMGPCPECFRYNRLSQGACVCYQQCPSNPVSDLVVGPYPTFQPSHVYTVTLDLGNGTPERLDFGMADCGCFDNSGTHTVLLTPVPGAGCAD